MPLSLYCRIVDSWPGTCLHQALISHLLRLRGELVIMMRGLGLLNTVYLQALTNQEVERGSRFSRQDPFVEQAVVKSNRGLGCWGHANYLSL